MKKTTIKVLGPENPCWNCKTVEKNATEAVETIDIPGVKFEVTHENIAGKEIKARFGVLRSPAVVADTYVLFQGEVPPVDKIRSKLRDLVTLLT